MMKTAPRVSTGSLVSNSRGRTTGHADGDDDQGGNERTRQAHGRPRWPAEPLLDEDAAPRQEEDGEEHDEGHALVQRRHTLEEADVVGDGR